MCKPLAILVSWSISFLLCSSEGFAQSIDDNGVNPVGWRDVSVQDVNYGRGNVSGRIYYPAVTAGRGAIADPNSGPFPLVSFMHGWTQVASEYDDLCTHLASWGFVVMSNNTETGVLFATMQNQARDTRALMQWVEDQSQDAGSWLAGMVNLGDWGAFGHSMGGGATAYLLDYDSRVRDVAMLEPYLGPLLGGTTAAFNRFDDFDGSVLVLGASLDLTNNWLLVVRPWYAQATGADRRAWALVEGGDHFGSTDWAGFGGTLAGAEQNRMHRRFSTGFFRAEMLGQANVWHDLLGGGIEGNPVSTEGAGTQPTMWALEDPAQPTHLRIGTFGNLGARARFAAALAPGSFPTPWGTANLDPATLQQIHDQVILNTDGVVEVSLFPRGLPSGTSIWLQSALTQGASGALSNSLEAVIP